MVYCAKGSFIKLGDGTIHEVRESCSIDLDNLEPYIRDGILTGAVPYKTVMQHFGVEKGTLEKHPTGLLTDDSLLKIMLGL